MTQYTRIRTYKEYEKKMSDYKWELNYMVGKKGSPMPLNVMIVSGDKGVGKTFTANELLSQQTIRPYKIVNSSMSAVQLYKFMWDNNDAIIVLDDVNSIIQDPKDGSALLKAATDSTPVRRLNWQKRNPDCIAVNMYNLKDNDAIKRKMNELAKMNKRMECRHAAGSTFPDTFFFTGALVILTNKPLSLIDRVTEGAVSNRGWHQEMLFDVDGAVALLKNSVNKMSNYMGQNIEAKHLKKALDFLTSDKAVKYYTDEDKLPTLRTLGKVALEIQAKKPIDDDTLINNTEPRAY